ncbi:hypothetical protein ACFL35_04360 [Candidatus Riflebacteria bacterium]
MLLGDLLYLCFIITWVYLLLIAVWLKIAIDSSRELTQEQNNFCKKQNEILNEIMESQKKISIAIKNVANLPHTPWH